MLVATSTLIAATYYLAVVILFAVIFVVAGVTIGAGKSFRLGLARYGLDGWLGVAILTIAISGIGFGLSLATIPITRYGNPLFTIGAAGFLAGSILAGTALGRYSEFALVKRAGADGDETDAITGHVAASDTVEAPLSGIQCVAHDTRIERRPSLASGDTNSWLIAARRTDAVPFRIDTTDVQLRFGETTVRLRPDVVEQPESELSDAARNVQEATWRNPAEETYRGVERRIEPGDKLTVYGRRTAAGFEAKAITDDPDGLHRELYTHVQRNGPVGVLLAVVGYVMLLVGAGVV